MRFNCLYFVLIQLFLKFNFLFERICLARLALTADQAKDRVRQQILIVAHRHVPHTGHKRRAEKPVDNFVIPRRPENATSPGDGMAGGLHNALATLGRHRLAGGHLVGQLRIGQDGPGQGNGVRLFVLQDTFARGGVARRAQAPISVTPAGKASPAPE